MYLMAEKENQIDIYSYKPISKKIIEYRKNIISTNPLKGYRLQTGITNQNKNVPDLHQTILTDEDINNYLKGKYDKQKIVAITQVGSTPLVMQYLLFIHSVLQKELDKTTILELPHELYLLHLLLNGHLKELEIADITDQLALFTFNYLRSFSSQDIKDLVRFGLITQDMDSIREEAKIGTNILIRVKNNAKN